MNPQSARKNPHLAGDELEFLCLVKPTPNPTPRAMATMRTPTRPMMIQNINPRRFCGLSDRSLCDARSGCESIFGNGVDGGGEAASFSVSSSGSWPGSGEAYSGAESLFLSLKSGLEGVSVGKRS